MKLELEQTDIEAIANRVAEILKPILVYTARDEEKDGLMNVRELAAYMRISAQCIYKLTSSNQIPHIKKGNKLLLFRKKEIEKWIASYNVPLEPNASSRLARKFL